MNAKKATPATKVFVKFPLKTLTVAATVGFTAIGHVVRMGPPAHQAGMKWMDETFKDIDKTFGK